MKLLIFTERKDTLDYLVDKLEGRRRPVAGLRLFHTVTPPPARPRDGTR